VRVFPGGVGGLFPRPGLEPGDASFPLDGVGVEAGGCERGVNGGGSALVTGAGVGGGIVGLTVFAGSAVEVNRLPVCSESGSSLDVGAGEIVSFAGGPPITALSTSTNPTPVSARRASSRPFRRGLR
jgi:hypothetical protein